jgi:hypothetical protein
VEGERFNLKKFFRCIVETLVFYVIVLSIYLIGEKMGNPSGAVQCISGVVYAIIYFYFVNILRNAHKLLPKSKGIKFLYYVLSFEIIKKIPYLQQRLDVAKEKRQKAEEDFRRDGVIGGSNNIHDDEEGQDIEEYEFTRLSPGDSLKLNIDVPRAEFDYSFKVLDQAVFAENQELPSGIVYQIQLFGLSSNADIQDLKGLSPVYESVSPSGMYIYRVGRFFTHDEASCHLEEVRGLGFRDVSIRALKDGKEISRGLALSAPMAIP